VPILTIIVKENIMALSNLAKKKAPGPAKAKASGIVLESEEVIQEAVESWVENNRAMKDAKANMEQAEQEILEYAEPKWHAACKSEGRVETSVKLGALRISWKSKSQFVTAASLGDGEQAKQVFGDDYEKYFTEQQGPLEFSPEALAHPEISQRLETLIETLMEEFPDVDIISTKTKVVPTDAIYQEFVLGNNEDIEQKLAAAGVKRTKPTFAQR
jgi:hypothetical protein